jgi:hypothetical protein
MDHGEEATESPGRRLKAMGGAIEAIIEGLSRGDGADVRVQAAQVLASLHRHEFVIVREDEQLPHLAPPTSDLIEAVTGGTALPITTLGTERSDVGGDAPSDDEPDAGADDELTPALA